MVLQYHNKRHLSHWPAWQASERGTTEPSAAQGPSKSIPCLERCFAPAAELWRFENGDSYNSKQTPAHLQAFFSCGRRRGLKNTKSTEKHQEESRCLSVAISDLHSQKCKTQVST